MQILGPPIPSQGEREKVETLHGSESGAERGFFPKDGPFTAHSGPEREGRDTSFWDAPQSAGWKGRCNILPP